MDYTSSLVELIVWYAVCLIVVHNWSRRDVCWFAVDGDSQQQLLPHEEEVCETVLKGLRENYIISYSVISTKNFWYFNIYIVIFDALKFCRKKCQVWHLDRSLVTSDGTALFDFMNNSMCFVWSYWMLLWRALHCLPFLCHGCCSWSAKNPYSQNRQRFPSRPRLLWNAKSD